MDEAQEASQESNEVTDEMLDRAAEGVEEEVVEEAAEETTEEVVEEVEESEEEVSEDSEDAPEEPEDNAERSRLGRKVKELEERENKLSETLEKLTSVLLQKDKAEEVEPAYFEMPETEEDLAILVKKQLDRIKEEEDSQLDKQAKEYQNGYIEAVQNLLADEPEEEQEAMFELINSEEFNIRHSKANSLQGGMMDAAKNVLAVKKHLLKASGGEKVIPLKGGKPKAPLGGGGGDKAPAPSKKVPKLDAAAEAYAKEMGMTDEQIIKALG